MLFLVVIIPLLIWLDIYLFKIYYKYMFNDKNDFQNSVKYTITPDIFSLFKGEYFKDKLAEAKLSGLILFCIITIFVEVLIVRKLLNLM